MTPKQRAEAHWDGYVGPMMRVMMDAAIEMSRFHYVTSHIHGAKHEQQDVQAPELSELLRRCGATTDPCATIAAGYCLSCRTVGASTAAGVLSTSTTTAAGAGT